MNEESKSLIEVGVRAQIVTFETEEATFFGKLFRSSMMGVSLAGSMSVVFALCSVVREKFRRKVYLDDIRTPKTFEDQRWRLQESQERLISDDNETEDILINRETISRLSKPLIEID
ncbi:hypothetical protein L596_024430 [Steinernema carpocapsae]|uniref:Uncharacterized protein n=1 Tax=Steinernema carpocapsae TaxID=34508 RepID=A0A4U5MGQ0_STECR|nr:hypothetical protein L596_024430 [Steinernema carpocapsae]